MRSIMGAAISTYIITPYNVDLLGDLIEMQFLGSAYNPNLGSAISLMMLLLVIIAMLIMNRFGDGEEGAVMM